MLYMTWKRGPCLPIIHLSTSSFPNTLSYEYYSVLYCSWLPGRVPDRVAGPDSMMVSYQLYRTAVNTRYSELELHCRMRGVYICNHRPGITDTQTKTPAVHCMFRE